MPYIIRMKAAHDKIGLSPYQVSKRTGVAINTIVKYTETDEVEAGQLSGAVARLSNFYGYKWWELIEFVGEKQSKDEDPTGQRKTLLTALA